jgi:hypothetical protein
MNIRFYFIIMLMMLFFGAWTYLAYEHSEIVSERYQEFSELPVYAYVADITQVDSILSELEQIPGIAGLQHETGFQAALELVRAYDLALDDNMISDYSFPDLITITFTASDQGIQARIKAMQILQQYLPPEDIDSQDNAYQKVIKSLARLNTRGIMFSVFATLSLFSFFIASRMSHELHRYLKQSCKTLSVVERIRFKRARFLRTWLMLILPAGLVTAIYYGAAYLQLWDFLPLWRSFVMMGLVSVLASLVLSLWLSGLDQEIALNPIVPEPELIRPEEEPDA